jgi:hypothetical protein
MIVFALPRLIPGDVVQLMLEEKAYGKDLEELRAKLGLDRPCRCSTRVDRQDLARRPGESPDAPAGRGELPGVRR